MVNPQISEEMLRLVATVLTNTATTAKAMDSTNTICWAWFCMGKFWSNWVYHGWSVKRVVVTNFGDTKKRMTNFGDTRNVAQLQKPIITLFHGSAKRWDFIGVGKTWKNLAESTAENVEKTSKSHGALGSCGQNGYNFGTNPAEWLDSFERMQPQSDGFIVVSWGDSATNMGI